MKKRYKRSNLTYFGWVAFAAWFLVLYQSALGEDYFHSISLYFPYDLSIILSISSILFFVGIYKNSTLPNRDKRDKLIGISYILICIGIFPLFILFPISLIGLALFLYAVIFCKNKK